MVKLGIWNPNRPTNDGSGGIGLQEIDGEQWVIKCGICYEFGGPGTHAIANPKQID